MTAAELTKYGLVPVARFCIVDNELKIVITDPETAKLGKCIYAFLIGGEAVRVGSSKAPLKERLNDYERDITNALNGRKSPAPAQEAAQWRKMLPAGVSGDIYARQGTEVTTSVGKFRVYMDEESILIGELFRTQPHDRILNRNKHR